MVQIKETYDFGKTFDEKSVKNEFGNHFNNEKPFANSFYFYFIVKCGGSDAQFFVRSTFDGMGA